MKHSEAVQYLRDALTCVQKVRSNAAEVLEHPYYGGRYCRATMIMEYPWVFDQEKTLLHPLVHLISRVDAGGQVSPQEFFNVMLVIEKFADIVNEQYIITCNPDGFPRADIKWLKGWEPE